MPASAESSISLCLSVCACARREHWMHMVKFAGCPEELLVRFSAQTMDTMEQPRMCKAQATLRGYRCH
jgi:hypothetical protein